MDWRLQQERNILVVPNVRTLVVHIVSRTEMPVRIKEVYLQAKGIPPLGLQQFQYPSQGKPPYRREIGGYNETELAVQAALLKARLPKVKLTITCLAEIDTGKRFKSGHFPSDAMELGLVQGSGLNQ